MNRNFMWPIVGVAAAILITTAMDATGLSPYSALPLLPLAMILWRIQRFSRLEVGLSLGRWRHYGLAALHPVVVIGVLTAIAIASDVTRLHDARWDRTALSIVVNSLGGILAVLLTEEGFFRGWLWASLTRAGLSERNVLLWSSLAFAAWHISAVTLDTGFNPEAAQVPVFLLNAIAFGVIWGRLRWISASVVVPSFCHSMWNAVAYALYGFGTRIGALGIKDTSVLAPEVGILGLILNVIFAVVLCYPWRGFRIANWR